MVHCGFEPTAVNDTFSGVRGMWSTVRATFLRTCPNPAAKRKLEALAAAKPKGKDTPLPVLSDSAA
jgi:hypothetical protein